MGTLESLRKGYDRLSPYERAVMFLDAVTREDEAGADALTPPTSWDSIHTTRTEMVFMMLAFVAVTKSLQAESAAWAGRLAAHIKDDAVEDPEETLAATGEAVRKAAAYLLALEALDNEIGGACLSMTDIFSGGFAGEALAMVKVHGVPFIGELEQLRAMYRQYAPCIAGAPRIEGPQTIQ